jgi:ABC-2 type transport system permease protein
MEPTMRAETFRRVLAGRRKSLLGWAIGIFAMMLLIVVSYPAVRDQPSLTDLLEDYPDFVQQILGLGGGLDLTSPAGYLNSQVFANTLPIIFLIFLIAFAARETVGEERDKTMNLALSHPIRRERFVLEKFAAMALTGLGLAAVSALTLIAFGPLVDMDLGLAGYVGATLSVYLIAMVFATLAFALGASTGSRPVAFGVTSALAVAMYILWGLAPLVDAIKGLDRLNPFYWGLAGTPILNGLQVGNALLLVALVVILAGAAVAGFRRRDIGT